LIFLPVYEFLAQLNVYEIAEPILHTNNVSKKDSYFTVAKQDQLIRLLPDS